MSDSYPGAPWQLLGPTSCPVSWQSSIRGRAETQAGTDTVEPERSSCRQRHSNLFAVISISDTRGSCLRLYDAGSSHGGAVDLGLTPPLADNAEQDTLHRLPLLTQRRLGLCRAGHGALEDHSMLSENILTLQHASLTLSRPMSKF